MVQLRCEERSEINCENTKKQLQVLETKIQAHLDLNKKQQEEAQEQEWDLKKEPEYEEDSGAQRELVLK